MQPCKWAPERFFGRFCLHTECGQRGSRVAAFLFLGAMLAACGGGGGGGTPATQAPGPTSCPSGYAGTAPNCTPVTTHTTAQGTVVNDTTGAAMAGVKVQLDPWTAFPTPGPTPTPIAVSTTDPSGHFVVTAPNGTYLLVIGTDAINTPPPGWSTPAPSAQDTPIPGAANFTATVHDRIVLNGQTILAAPTMPPVALYTPPATETGSSYRLATLNALTEVPCVLAYNTARTSFGLSGAVIDEWLVENSRAFIAQHESPQFYVNPPTPEPSNPFGYLASGSGFQSGGNNCAQMMTTVTTFDGQLGVYSKNANAQWFGGIYAPYAPGNSYSAYGLAEYPIEPRVYSDPNVPIWP